mgnify:CR=1 FL=1
MSKTVTVLVVDDEKRFADNLVKILVENEITAEAVYCGEDAIARLEKAEYDVVLLDYKMPGMAGKETLRVIASRSFPSEVIILTGHASANDAVDILEMGAMDYLLKPCKTSDLLEKITFAVEAKELKGKEIKPLV